MAMTTVILAGGQGRRMGGMNKALLPCGEEAFIDRQIRLAGQGSDEIIVVSNDSVLNIHLQKHENVRVVPDVYVGEGPLAGLHAGLMASSHEMVWLIGCDQPFLDLTAASYLLRKMAEGQFQAVVPVVGGRNQPLHAIYRKEIGVIAESLLYSGERSFVSLLEHVSWLGIEENEFIESGISLKFTDDIDTPEQYDKELKELLP